MTASQEYLTYTPAEFAELAVSMGLAPQADEPETPEDYFVVNRETGKLELHFSRSMYDALTDDQKQSVRSSFLWGRKSGCWISRAKEPNLYHARRCAEALGLADAGNVGECLSYAEQMARKAERAGHQAERFEARSEAAYKQGEALQKPINDMHGDISFFTQPNINTSAGRAFTRRRDRMWASFERGFEAFNKSAYWEGRAKARRAAAEQKTLQDKGFVMRRIDERQRDIRALKNSVEEYEAMLADLAEGRTPRDKHGWEVKRTEEQLREQIDIWLDRLEVKLDELGYYQDCLDRLGGVTFSKDNLAKGDLLIISRWREPVRFLRGGPKNFTYEFTLPHMTYADGSPMQGQAAYAEIVRRADKTE